MFERYTEKARRVIFFARYEASIFGSPYIETEHLLLGLLREDKALADRVLKDGTAVDSLRAQIELRTMVREKISTSVDLPLSNESKRVLADAAEEAGRLSHHFIGTEHLLLGLLRGQGSLAAELLVQQSVDAAAIRAHIEDLPPGSLREPLRSGFSQPRFWGKYRGVVLNEIDPEQLGRLQVSVPALSALAPLAWANPCTPFPVPGTSPLTVPPKGTSVWVEFEGGNPDLPIWSGCFWTPGQRPLLTPP